MTEGALRAAGGAGARSPRLHSREVAKTASGHEHCSLVQYCSCVQWFVWSHMVISSIFNLIFAIPTPHPNRLRAFKRVGLGGVSAHPLFVALSKSAPLALLRMARLLRLRERCPGRC